MIFGPSSGEAAHQELRHATVQYFPDNWRKYRRLVPSATQAAVGGQNAAARMLGRPPRSEGGGPLPAPPHYQPRCMCCSTRAARAPSTTPRCCWHRAAATWSRCWQQREPSAPSGPCSRKGSPTSPSSVCCGGSTGRPEGSYRARPELGVAGFKSAGLSLELQAQAPSFQPELQAEAW